MGMREEMAEQPAVLRRFLDQGIDRVREIARAVSAREPKLAYLVARGSSDNAALYAKYLLGVVNRLPAASAAPSMWTLYDSPPALKNALVIGISQSGASTDLVRVMTDATRQGATTVAVTNAPGSPLAEAAEFVIDIGAGPELSIAATKTYTATLLALASLSALMADDRELLDGLGQAPSEVERALLLDTATREAAKTMSSARYCIVIGRGYNFATAHEWALKIKELAQVVAEPYSSADFRHGPIALVEKDFPVLAINVRGKAEADVSALLDNLVSVTGASLCCAGDVESSLALAEVGMPLDLGAEIRSPIAAVVPGQLLAWNLALVRGLDPDRPRGLSKITRTN